MNEANISLGATKQNFGIGPAPFLFDSMTTGRIMLITSAALIPALGVTLYYFGFGAFWQFLICVITGIVTEAAVALLRHRKVIHVIFDFSWLVTALILALTLPPLTVWYLTVATALFAFVIVKQVFGGLGMNIFNPAMTGFVFLIISAPGALFTSYLTPADAAIMEATPVATYNIIFNREDSKSLRETLKELSADEVNTFSGATYLESVKTAKKAGAEGNIRSPDFTRPAFAAYLWLAAAYLLGGIVLMIFRIIIKRMVFAYFVSLVIFSCIGHLLFPELFMTPVEQLLLGGTMLCGFFIITDPVTNAGTSKGRIVFAIFVAFLIVLIRAKGSYSDSVAFAIMLGNAAAPLIDVLTRRRPYGVGYRKGGMD